MTKQKVAPWITPGAELQTRSGLKARIYAVDGEGVCPVHGAMQKDNGGWAVSNWMAQGAFTTSGEEHGGDLMKPVRRRVAYVFLDEQGNLLLSSAPTKTHGRLIVGSVRVEVVEGEFAAVDGEEPWST